MNVEGAKTLDIPCFFGKSFNIQDGVDTYLNKGKKYIVRRIIKHEGVGIWSWMLKEIPETLMLWAFDPLQHDLRTDMGTDGFIYLYCQNLWKYLCFLLIEQMEQMIYYLNLKRKKVYIRNIIRELSKDVFYLFYLFHSTDGNRYNEWSVTVKTLVNTGLFQTYHRYHRCYIT